MTDVMRPLSFEELLNRILSEYSKDKTIFSFSPQHSGPKELRPQGLALFGESGASPIGPAAGPHTQLAQNIVCSWLSGARFFELKTVQIMDTLEIAKPCIDAEDEGFNTEWSSEFTLTKAYDEYLKAWFLCHLMQLLFDESDDSVEFQRDFIFNMSVGYDLAGIQTPRMQEFINRLQNSEKETLFAQYGEALIALSQNEELLSSAGFAGKGSAIRAMVEAISPQICRSMTLSTMHGCPPEEIEKIAVYLLTEKKIHTFVKLNPTLLGFDQVRNTLDSLGYDYVGLKQESFDHDLQYPDAVAMLIRLQNLAKEQKLNFGVKLTNTLGSINNQGKLPGDEMYMSGRALFPISIQVALKLSKEFGGNLPISFSGGATAANVADLLECGIRPITMATDLLKPGGYGRLSRAVDATMQTAEWNRDSINLQALEALCESALSTKDYHKDLRGKDIISTGEDLSLFDCATAPCQSACAIHQDIPEYIKLVGEGRFTEALEVIYNKNPLPSITGWICDHQCQYNCTRMDYEGSVHIRDMKKIAVCEGWEGYIKNFSKPADGSETGISEKVAVIGAGPAGLASAYFLRRGGMDVTIFEREESAGGVINHILPGFRLPQEAITQDIEFIESHGVNFEFGQKDMTIKKLQSLGYGKIIVAVGAESHNELGFKESKEGQIIPALKFLHNYRKDSSKLSVGKSVAIVGGGNTAMDSARSAKRLPGVEEVHVIYRRSLSQMPADREEYLEAKAEGVQFHFLRNPASLDADGNMTCTIMELGEADSSGRSRALATDQTESFKISTLITAIGEKVDNSALEEMGISVSGKWVEVDPNSNETPQKGVYLVGDAQTGPLSIVGAMGSARKAVNQILASKGVLLTPAKTSALTQSEISDVKDRKSSIISNPNLNNKGGVDFKEWAAKEASRCLSCSSICNKCVDVCPNRANVVIKVDGKQFRQGTQILHLDSYCNECGNCAQFCPWNGQPYKNKFTLYSRKEDFTGGTNSGFFFDSTSTVSCRIGSQCYEMTWNGKELDGSALANTIENQRVLSLTKTVLTDYLWYCGPVED